MTMKRDVNPTFSSALAGAGRRTTPEELAKNGVRKLRTYKLSEISLLIEKALNKTLVQRTLSPMGAEEMAEISAAAETELKSQLESLEELRASRGALARHRDSVSRELEDLRDLVTERRAKKAAPDGLRHLLLEIRGAIRPLTDQAAVPDWITKDVVADLHALIESRSTETLTEERAGFDAEIAKLERRIAKLVGSIESMERALEKLARTKDLESGIASIYRTVQGLSNDEQDVDQKRLMMAAMFAANLELRDKLNLAAGG